MGGAVLAERERGRDRCLQKGGVEVEYRRVDKRGALKARDLTELGRARSTELGGVGSGNKGPGTWLSERAGFTWSKVGQGIVSSKRREHA